VQCIDGSDGRDDGSGVSRIFSGVAAGAHGYLCEVNLVVLFEIEVDGVNFGFGRGFRDCN